MDQLPPLHYQPMHPGLASFLYVLSAFSLIALIPILAAVGYALYPAYGGAIGGFIGIFILTWMACWFIRH